MTEKETPESMTEKEMHDLLQKIGRQLGMLPDDDLEGIPDRLEVLLGNVARISILANRLNDMTAQTVDYILLK